VNWGVDCMLSIEDIVSFDFVCGACCDDSYAVILCMFRTWYELC